MSLVFEYPDGPFQNTFRFDPETKTWTSLMRQKNKGNWSVFAEDKFIREGPNHDKVESVAQPVSTAGKIRVHPRQFFAR